MIQKFLKSNNALSSTGIHFVLGLLSSQSKYVFIAWFFLVLIAEIPNLLNPSERLNVVLNRLIVYLVSFEILGRMVRATPIIPQEMGKYLLCILFIYGILQGYNKGKIGIFFLLLLIPALFYDLSGEVDTNGIVFNLLGPIDLSLGIIYFKGQHITQKQLMDLLKLALYPIIATLAFTVIRTPDFDDINFALSANVATSGGFGSNQVSTVFGLGLLLIFMLWISGKIISGYRTIDSFLILLFVFRGFLTFSRGGMLGAAVAILIFLFLIILPGNQVIGTIKLTLPKVTLYSIPIVILGLIVFQIANDITGNNLLLRYKGETAGTLAGMKEVDINTITSNRYNIFMGDMELWQEHFNFGVGAGASQYLREDDIEERAAAHIEFSRLVAEHGLLGLFFFGMLLTLPFTIWRENQNPLNRAILFSLFVLGIYTSFHAAMRTYVTPLFVGMSLISIKELLPRLPRKKPQANPSTETPSSTHL
jgi:hypothetical protein